MNIKKAFWPQKCMISLMKIRNGFIGGLLYLATVIASDAITIKISGVFFPQGIESECPESFGITIDYDSSYSPEFVSAGTVVSDPKEGTAPIAHDYYLYSLEGIKGFSAFAGSTICDSGTWSGLSSPKDGTSKLWFSSNLCTQGVSPDYFYGGFYGPGLSISIGDLYMDTGLYVADVTIRNPEYGFKTGDVKIHVVPDSTATGWLLVSALSLLALSHRYFRMVRARPLCLSVPVK